jgi:prepilin-type N-terminal cleavage/methylation domain-containing protein
MHQSAIRKAFTLVEILIVVVILGILAAIVVPQFTSATQDSQAGNIRSQLGTLQRQIELFQSKNNSYPTFATGAASVNWAPMISGGFIKTPPKNPAWPNQSADEASRVASGTVFGSNTTGWCWHTTNNQIYASYFMDNPASSANANFNKVYTGTFAAGTE